MNQPKHPMQPLLDDDGVRFQSNAIVCWMLDELRSFGIGMNEITCADFSQEDRCQFAQLIGYSLSGYHELPYVSDSHALAASEAARKTWPKACGCRDVGCEIHSGLGEADADRR